MSGQSSPPNPPESRADRFRREFDADYQFTLKDKLAFLCRKGWPVLLVVLVGITIGSIIVTNLRSGVRPDTASKQEEDEALRLLTDAQRTEATGEVGLAVEKLRYLILKHPTTFARTRADEMLARHDRGERFTEAPKAKPTKIEPVADAKPKKSKAELELDKAIETALATPADLPTARMPNKHAPAGFAAARSSGAHVSGWPTKLTCVADDSEMMLVPIPETLRDEGDAEVFYIDRGEITWRQYQKFLNANPDHPKPGAAATKVMTSDKHPVVGVRHADAIAYCQWAKKSLPTAIQYRLAAGGRTFVWGDDESLRPTPRKELTIDAGFRMPVDRSPLAIFDLAGNAAEWTTDWANESAKQRLIVSGDADWTVHWTGAQPEHLPAPWLGFRGVLELPSTKPAQVVAQRPAPPPPPPPEPLKPKVEEPKKETTPPTSTKKPAPPPPKKPSTKKSKPETTIRRAS